MSELNIDQGTLNGFGVVTINLANNYVESVQYHDLNTDYYVVCIHATDKDYYFVTNYDILSYSGVEKIAGPFTTKDEAMSKMNELNYGTLTNNQFVVYSCSGTTVTVSIISKIDNYIKSDFTFFAPAMRS